jgi:molecular chaperone DnaK
LKDAHKREDLTAIDAATTKLNQVFQAASQEMYNAGQQAGGQPGGGAGQPGGQQQGGQQKGGNDGEVTDVDFEEVK